MATNKTIQPTNVTVQIPAMTDAPDASVFSNAIDKSIDGINALNSQLGKYADLGVITNLDISTRVANTVYHFTFGATIADNPFGAKSGHGYLYVNDSNSYGSQILYSDGGIKMRKLSNSAYGAWQNLITL